MRKNSYFSHNKNLRHFFGKYTAYKLNFSVKQMAKNESGSNSNGWSKNISTIGTVLMPLVLLYLGHVYKESEEKSGLHEQYVELALQILEDDSTTEHPYLREWAIDIVHHYSPVDVTDELREHVIQGGLLQKQSMP
jgi:hypothetical protein